MIWTVIEEAPVYAGNSVVVLVVVMVAVVV